jgi:hypothetical protein
MNDKVEEAMHELHRVAREESSEECISFQVFINCNGISYEANHRDAESLRKDGVSMRNLRGDWIK